MHKRNKVRHNNRRGSAPSSASPLQALKPPGQKLGGFSISEMTMYGKKPMKPAKKPMKPGKYGPKK